MTIKRGLVRGFRNCRWGVGILTLTAWSAIPWFRWILNRGKFQKSSARQNPRIQPCYHFCIFHQKWQLRLEIEIIEVSRNSAYPYPYTVTGVIYCEPLYCIPNEYSTEYISRIYCTLSIGNRSREVQFPMKKTSLLSNKNLLSSSAENHPFYSSESLGGSFWQ